MKRTALFLIITFLALPILLLPFKISIGKGLPAYSLTNLIQNKGHGLANSLDSWFLKRLVFLPLLVRTKNEMLYQIGHSEELIFGIDGYSADRGTLEKIIPQVDEMTEEEMLVIAEKLSLLRDYLDTKGVFFIVCIVPYKTTKDFIPFNTGYLRKSFGIDRLQKNLIQKRVPFIDVLSSYRRTQNTHYKTDVHNNSVGKSIVQSDLLRRLHSEFSLPFVPKKMVDEVSWFEGANNNAMPKLFALGEYTIRRSAKGSPQFENVYIKPVRTFKPKEKKDGRLPKTLMIGNSFMLGYEDLGLVDYFESFSRILDYTHFKNFEDHLGDNKIVILHLYEGQISFHLNTPSYWPKIP